MKISELKKIILEIINEEDPDCELFAQYRTIVDVFRDHQVVVFILFSKLFYNIIFITITNIIGFDGSHSVLPVVVFFNPTNATISPAEPFLISSL